MVVNWIAGLAATFGIFFSVLRRGRLTAGVGAPRSTRLFMTGAAVAVACMAAACSSPNKVQTRPFMVDEATIAEVHAAFREGSLTCRQLVTQYLDRIKAYSEQGPRLNAMINLNPAVLQEADALDKEHASTRQLRPMHCIPVTLKDSINTAGIPTTAGSAALKNAVPKEDAFLVSKLKRSGAIILAKNTLGDLSGASYSTIVGIPRNPYNINRSPGGSSSGSGVAVAANLTMVAVGEDTLTSVRTPAAFTNIVGLRPTTGLISASGIVPRKVNIDTAGPLARTVTDAAVLLRAMAGPDPANPLSETTYRKYPEAAKAGGGYRDFTTYLDKGALKGARIGVAGDFFGGDPEIDKLAQDAIDQIKALGAEVVDVRFDKAFFDTYVQNGLQNLTPILMYPFKEVFEAYLATQGPDVPKTVEEWINIYENEITKSAFPPETARPSHALLILRESLKHSSIDPEYRKMVNETLPMLTREKRALFDKFGVDALVMPYQPTFADPIVTPIEQQKDAAFVPAPGKVAPNTIGGYGSEGFPMVIVPMGFGTQGLPMGLAIMGRPYSDGEILGYAYAYEQASHHRRAPKVAPPLETASR
jgi:amidase